MDPKAMLEKSRSRQQKEREREKERQRERREKKAPKVFIQLNMLGKEI